jgi:hypothetical protein
MDRQWMAVLAGAIPNPSAAVAVAAANLPTILVVIPNSDAAAAGVGLEVVVPILEAAVVPSPED